MFCKALKAMRPNMRSLVASVNVRLLRIRNSSSISYSLLLVCNFYLPLQAMDCYIDGMCLDMSLLALNKTGKPHRVSYSRRKQERMRQPGVEPGSPAWKAGILTVGLLTRRVTPVVAVCNTQIGSLATMH